MPYYKKNVGRALPTDHDSQSIKILINMIECLFVNPVCKYFYHIYVKNAISRCLLKISLFTKRNDFSELIRAYEFFWGKFSMMVILP